MHKAVPAEAALAADRNTVSFHSVLGLVVLRLGCGEFSCLLWQVPFLHVEAPFQRARALTCATWMIGGRPLAANDVLSEMR